MRKARTPSYRFSNLYKFIRLIIGDKLSDRQFAHKWKMDEKNFYDFKVGRYPVPRIERLITLAKILGIPEQLVFEVASGASAKQVYTFIKKNKSLKKDKFLTQQFIKPHQPRIKYRQKFERLFNVDLDAIWVVDVKSNRIIECNEQTEKLLGKSRDEIIGMGHSQLYPSAKRNYYEKQFSEFIRGGHTTGFNVLEIKKNDNTVIPVLSSSNIFNIKGQKVVQGVFRDLSKLKRYEELIPSLSQGKV